jgi:peptidase E
MAARRPQIIAIGGGSFTVEPDNPRLERYVLAQAGRKRARVCFLGTATGDADTYVAKFYAAFTKLNCIPTHLPLFARTPDLREVLLGQDVIYVGGGNTRSMLAVWREWGIDRILGEAWRRGIVLTGVSAGAICWFDTGVTDSWEGGLRALPCLGFLRGGCCPHYDGEKERRPAAHLLVKSREIAKTLALDDGAAAHFVGRSLVRIVSARPSARGYEVRARGASAIETPLPTLQLSPAGIIRRSRSRG